MGVHYTKQNTINVSLIVLLVLGDFEMKPKAKDFGQYNL